LLVTHITRTQTGEIKCTKKCSD